MNKDLFVTASNHCIGNCRAAITAIRLHNDTITSDSARWHDVWLNAHSTLINCVELPQGIGGYHHIGAKALRNALYHLRI